MGIPVCVRVRYARKIYKENKNRKLNNKYFFSVSVLGGTFSPLDGGVNTNKNERKMFFLENFNRFVYFMTFF